MNRLLFYAIPGVLCLGTLVTFKALGPSPLQSLDITPVQAQTPPAPLEVMTLERLETILSQEVDNLEGGRGQWQFTIGERSLILLADPTNNRMRIVSPIAPASSLSGQQVQAMLVANFHSALDARYAVTDGTVVSVFLHPLSSLQETDLRSSLRQVATLADNFGTSYSSGGLGFGAIGEPSQEGSSSQGDFEI